MEAQKHRKCSGVRGIKTFKCKGCGKENSTNYMNGVNYCTECVRRMGICCVCGKLFTEDKDILNPSVLEWIANCVKLIRAGETDKCVKKDIPVQIYKIPSPNPKKYVIRIDIKIEEE